jgi:hypothetical protein
MRVGIRVVRVCMTLRVVCVAVSARVRCLACLRALPLASVRVCVYVPACVVWMRASACN